jgi:Reverse transcriptase (RNA-dependent DNA polymerase)
MRQLAVVTARDHARLRATTTTVAEIARQMLNDHCYSAKLATPPPNWNFKSNQYFTFMHAAIKRAKTWDCVGMVRTDVESYFPSISVDALLRTLWDSGCDKESIQFVVQTILTWQDTCKDLRGIPIGPEACALLGTFFLDPVDAVLDARARAFFRYMDDIAYLYGPNLAQDRGYGMLDEALARLGLKRSEDKTHYAESPSGAVDLMRRRDLAYVEAYVQRIPNVPIGPVKAFFDEVVMPTSPVDLAGLRKCLAAFLTAKDMHAVYPLLNSPVVFDADPKVCANYLQTFLSNDDVGRAMARRLRSSNVPAASRVHAMRLLAGSNLDQSMAQSLLTMAADRSSKRPVAVWAVSAYGHAKSYHLIDVLDALSETESPDVRRAAILTMRGRQDRGRRYVGRSLSKGSAALELSTDWALAA